MNLSSHHKCKLFLTFFVSSFSLIYAQNVPITDVLFRSALINHHPKIDVDNDNEITLIEAANYTGELKLANFGITDLKGIEAFTKITSLDCSRNMLKNIDVSKNVKLVNLKCDDNLIVSLNVANGNNAKLIIDASANPDLKCIQHDKDFKPTSTWKKDENVVWKDDCSDLVPCDDVVIIPDARFKKALLAYGKEIDQDQDGEICVREAVEYTGAIDVSSKGIVNLKGIAAFKKLKFLNCSNNSLVNLDLSSNTELEKLNCENNNLSILNVANGNNSKMMMFSSGNLNLKCIQHDINFDPVTKPYDPNNFSGWSKDTTANWSVNCSYIDVSSIKISGDSNVKVHGKPLCLTVEVLPNTATSKAIQWRISRGTRFAVINNKGILYPLENGLVEVTATAIDGSGVIGKFEVNIINQSSCKSVINFPDSKLKTALLNHLPKVDVDGDGEICKSEAQYYAGKLNLASKQLTNAAGLHEFINAKEIDCSLNELTSLDLTSNLSLTKIDCSGNRITTLLLGDNANLKTLYCQNNMIKNLDVSKAVNLKVFECFDNKLAKLSILTNKKLEQLNCTANQLENLSVSANVNLKQLYCGSNKLKTLILGKSNRLNVVHCNENQLVSVDLSKLTVLNDLIVKDNKITSLDLSNNKQLSSLNCISNALTSLNIANSKSAKISLMYATQNDKLKCIKHDKGFSPNPNNWTKDDLASWSSDCSEVTEFDLVIQSKNGKVIIDPKSDSGRYEKNTKLSLTAKAVKGYKFTRWEGSVSSTQNPLKMTMDSNKSIQAVFEKVFIKQFVLKLENSNGSVAVSPKNNNNFYDKNSKLTLTVTPDVGYEFIGWSGDVSGSTNPLVVVMDKAKTIVAKFKKIPTKFTLTTKAINGKIVSLMKTLDTKFVEGTSLMLTAVPDKGYTFISWSGDIISTVNPIKLTIDSNKSIAAKFEKLKDAIKVPKGYNIKSGEPLIIQGNSSTIKISIKLYDKNGRLLYTSDDYKDDFSGVSSSGNVFLSGSYVYVIAFKNGEEIIENKGWIYILN